MAASCPKGRPRSDGDRPPRPRFNGPSGPMRGNATLRIPANHECSLHAGQAHMQCGCALHLVGSVCSQEGERLPFMKRWVEETEVQVLRETGCNGVIVKYDLVPPRCFTGCHQRLILMDRSVVDGPVAKVEVDKPVFRSEMYALCIQNPICDLIIGNIPGALQVSLGAMTTEELPSTTRTEEVREQRDTTTASATQVGGWHGQADRATKPLKTSDRWPSCRALQMTPDEFQAAQKADTQLSRFFEIARDDMIDKEIDNEIDNNDLV